MNTEASDVAIQIGINARIFPANWRPIRAEIDFAHKHGFRAIQFSVRDAPLDETLLGDPFPLVADALATAGLTAAVELVVPLTPQGQTPDGRTMLDTLRTTLPAIRALACCCVHWHPVPAGIKSEADIQKLDRGAMQRLEEMLLPQVRQGVALAGEHGFRLGVEHNEPELLLCASPQSCRDLLADVPGLGFVWDLNHTAPEDLAGFQALASRISLVHVSDTPLPQVNHHLPLGLGAVDLIDHAQTLLGSGFAGPAILEIGGLPKSGGYGRDTNAALIDSGRRLAMAIEQARSGLA